MTLDRRELLAVFGGGAFGALARVALTELAPQSGSVWPWTVFSINLGGTLLLAHLVTRLQERLPLSTYRRQLLGTGFCGAFTTFSTMQLELLKMFDTDRYALAAAYLAASVVCGYVAVYAATVLTRRVRIIA